MEKKVGLGLGIVVLLILASLTASAETIKSYVTDQAGVLSPNDIQVLEQKLQQLQESTNNVQLVVFIEKTIPSGMSLEDRSLSLAESNGIGKEGNDNGILFYLATDDRQYRWEIGYGVEDVLNAALLGRISRSYMVPFFQEGNYAAGIGGGVDIVRGILLNTTDEDIAKVLNADNNKSSTRIIILTIIVIIALFAIIFAEYYRKGHGFQAQKGRSSFHDSVYIGAASSMFGRGGFGGFRGGSGGFGGLGGSFGGGGFSGRF